jgi:hypothetical protein
LRRVCRKYHRPRFRRYPRQQGKPLAKGRQQVVSCLVIRRAWLSHHGRPGEQSDCCHTELPGNCHGLGQQTLVSNMHAVKCADGHDRRLPVFWQSENILHAE